MAKQSFYRASHWRAEYLSVFTFTSPADTYVTNQGVLSCECCYQQNRARSSSLLRVACLQVFADGKRKNYRVPGREACTLPVTCYSSALCACPTTTIDWAHNLPPPCLQAVHEIAHLQSSHVGCEWSWEEATKRPSGAGGGAQVVANRIQKFVRCGRRISKDCT